MSFAYSFKVKQYIKNGHGVKWSNTFRCFYALDKGSNRALLASYLQAGGYTVKTADITHKQLASKGAPKPKDDLSQEKQLVYTEFISFLKGKRYSESTLKVY
ncbi:MAG: hypothetical protein HN847_07685, partial [Bacteroidetes bacterium]|nr:hypothetical protein [Bacteroidota bacterium]